MRVLAFAALAAVLFYTPRLAGAQSGEIRITQAQALAGGVSPGDTPGFPVTISQPGVYRLEGNIVAPGTAIVIESSNVVLNLRGFELVGSTGNGIELPLGVTDVTIKDGSIRGFERGVLALNGPGPASRNVLIERIRAIDNTFHGIFCAPGCVVRYAYATGNGAGLSLADDGGIKVGFGSRVEYSQAIGNFGAGIDVSDGDVVRNCVTRGNELDGIRSDANSRIFENVTSDNGEAGIRAVQSNLVQANTASANGSEGIFAAAGSSTLENTSESNGGFGLLGGGGYAKNVFTANNGGQGAAQVSAFSGTLLVDLGRNLCATDQTCP